MPQGKQKSLLDLAGRSAGMILLEEHLRTIDPTTRVFYFIHDCVNIECSDAKALEVRAAADKFIMDKAFPGLLPKIAALQYPLGVVGTLCPRCRAGLASEEHNLCWACHEHVHRSMMED